MGARAKVMTIFEQTDKKGSGLIKKKALAGVIEAVGGLERSQIEQLMQQVYPGPEDKVPYAKFVEHLFRLDQGKSEPALTITTSTSVADCAGDCPGLPNIGSVDLRAVFGCFDLQKLGRVSRDDVATIVHNRDSNQALVEISRDVPQLAALLGENTWHDAFSAMDIDGNEVVSWFEFLRYFAFQDHPAPIAAATARGKMLEEDLLAVFIFMDENRNGRLEKEELQKAASVDDAAFRLLQSRVPALKALLHPDSWERSFRALDTNRDGSVCWLEYTRFFRAMFNAMPG